jgi:hypothetical protein
VRGFLAWSVVSSVDVFLGGSGAGGTDLGFQKKKTKAKKQKNKIKSDVVMPRQGVGI